MSNADTDSISFRKQDSSPFLKEEQQTLINEINSLMSEMIEFEHDGYYDTVLVIKAKNYVMRTSEGSELILKGSSLKDTKKEPALKEMLQKLIMDLIDTNGEHIVDIYNKYIKEAYNIQDIKRWVTKKSITKAVMNPERLTEQKVLNALKGKNFQEGDKIWVYSAIDGEKQKIVKGEPVFFKKTKEPKMVPNTVLKLEEYWDGDYDRIHYVQRVWDTIMILENLLDKDQIIKYHLKSNQKLLNII
jgi:DNA polymerase elongation subunit (family B)